MNPLADRLLPSELGDLADIARWRARTRPAGDPGPTVVLSATSDEAAIAAAAVCAVNLGKDASSLTPPNLGSDGRIQYDRWMTECASIRDQILAIRQSSSDPEEMLADLPAPLVACAQAIAELPVNQTPALLDGPTPAAAVLLAYLLDPEVLEWVRPLQPGAGPTERAIWDYLRITPILPYVTGINDGSLGPLADVVMDTAVAQATQMSAATRAP
ncbi:MAG: nicotinate-nucleotide--dimethylbenzimidazole phosphoribosyltransferase [Actinomycetes bacterium]